ncbi:tetratricopeptide repeat-containing hybrid sensor histidine kinase/response regulator [Aequorivita vladivostokensis]|uniref:tetratricopeptide repeat-containing hybrid sensor histidine kinase/response regulator n=1 Tax=Aequorivita vladivostokensis TaxID=171194 RepID=UPI0006977234|nr:ATP-binding protein [Aequorivita vladivostokensis]MAB56598.1 hybrid sensor histidine kinase/response regulator [Aequorivita sp.]MBF31663.1 hybrid sensor histidine kinase/response regulator [Aequorivita sp.]HAV53599.1 hybrid sensor histidine kinase/response regulator [Aequorivita sp.]
MKYLRLILLLTSFAGIAQNSPDTISSLKNISFEAIKDSLDLMQDRTDKRFFEGKYDSVILTSIDNIRFAEQIGDTEAAYYSRYMMGAAFIYLKDFKNAHEYADAYLEYAEKTKNEFNIARGYNLIGALYLTEKKYDSALPFLKKALPLSLKRKDTLEASMVYYNLSESYLNKGEKKKAQLYFNKAEEGIDALKFKGFTTEMNLLAGKLKLASNQPMEAIENFREAISFAEEGKYIDDNLIEAYKEYSIALFEVGDFKEAFLVRKKFDSLTQIQFEKEKLIAIQNAAAQFSVNEYKKQARQAELEKKLLSEKALLSNILLAFFIGAAILMGIFLVILYISHRGRKKLTLTLKEKNQQYLKAKQKSEKLALAKSKFFSTVSHELRTPLYGVIGLSSVLLEDESLKSHRADLKNLKFSADYLLALINDVLQISKLESNTLEEMRVPFDLRELTQSIVSSFQYALVQNKNTLHVNISDNIPNTIIGDRVRLSQILMNLVGNAIKFTTNGNIYITAQEKSISENGVDIQFSIEDNGIGIPKGKQKAIFEEFQQVDSENFKIQGTGLGLTIVKKLLEASNSSIKLKSEPGKGSTFSFTLKFEIMKHLLQDKVLGDNNILTGKRILVVDDNRINQIVTKKILENNGMIAVIAENGDTAIAKLQTEIFDLVLMDINMPGKDGIETTQEIRKFDQITPIVALTAIEVEEMRTRIETSGMNDIIVKPYDTDKFLKIILSNLVDEEDLVFGGEHTSAGQ